MAFDLECVCLNLMGFQRYNCEVLPFPDFFGQTVQLTKCTNLLHSGILAVDFFNSLTTGISSKVACILVLGTSMLATELCNSFAGCIFLAPTAALALMMFYFHQCLKVYSLFIICICYSIIAISFS